MQNISTPPPVQARIFPTTDLTLIEVLKSADAAQSAAALNQLCHRYWAPIHAALKMMGPEARMHAEDWTQDFLTSFAVERDGFARLDKTQARLRTFLQRSLRNFVINRVEESRAAKRGGGQAPSSLEDAPEISTPEASDAWFDRLWACEVLRRAEERLCQLYDGRSTPWSIIKPFLLSKVEPGEYEAAALTAGKSADALKMEVHRVRQAFRDSIEAEVSRTVAAGVNVREEMLHLIACLAHAPAEV
jgi:RNA polymerase sigma-70 factor (ECF subfamily)